MKFIRKNGRIIPIKEKGEKKLKRNETEITRKKANGEQVSLVLSEKKNTIGQRFGRGFSAGAKAGGVLGGILGLVSSESSSLKGTLVNAAAGAVGGAASWGSSIGVLNAVFGQRKDWKVKSVERKKKK
jgi:hypothetical protein